MNEQAKEEKEILRGKKVLLTFNNPIKWGYLTYEPDDMKKVYFEPASERFASIIYMSCTKEKGLKEETEHDHLFILAQQALWRTSLQKLFPHADIRFCDAEPKYIDDYIKKTGKQEGTEKEETRIDGYQFQWGEIPVKKQGKRTDLDKLKQMILDGKSNAEIYETDSNYIKYCGSIDRVRNDLLSDKYKKTWRNLKVCYVFGKSGAGKTRYVMEKYGYENVYRITDYDHPWDNYKNEKVVIFEEFRSSLKIQDMLNYLDGYPLSLPSRYANRQACFTIVYIITNIGLEEQFVSVQENHPETYQAFLRRIHKIKEYKKSEIIEYFQDKDENDEYNYFDENNQKYMEKINDKKENKTYKKL